MSSASKKNVNWPVLAQLLDMCDVLDDLEYRIPQLEDLVAGTKSRRKVKGALSAVWRAHEFLHQIVQNERGY